MHFVVTIAEIRNCAMVCIVRPLFYFETAFHHVIWCWCKNNKCSAFRTIVCTKRILLSLPATLFHVYEYVCWASSHFINTRALKGHVDFQQQKSHKLIVISNFAICSQGLVIRSHELVICFRELDNPSFWIAVRSLDLHNSFPLLGKRTNCLIEGTNCSPREQKTFLPTPPPSPPIPLLVSIWAYRNQ